ncbi:MAG: hypothetical protein WA485_27740, partial [Candidatus Sulfotelmatobacter sp.]
SQSQQAERQNHKHSLEFRIDFPFAASFQMSSQTDGCFSRVSNVLSTSWLSAIFAPRIASSGWQKSGCVRNKESSASGLQ